jgi:hypothetical protein
MARRRRMPPKAQDGAGAPPEIAGDQEGGPMNTDNAHADPVQSAGDEGREHQTAPEIASPITADEYSVHETLLEGVSTDAIVASGTGRTGSPSDTDEATAEADPAPLADDLTVVPEEASAPVPGATEAVEAVGAAVETVARVPETIAASLPVAEAPPAGDHPTAATQHFGTVLDLAKSPRIAEVMGELGAVNATVLTYLRGESSAAMAHWQALSGAKTPADAIRIQVDEMQRAADASLSCFAALAQRVSQFTAGIGRA